MITHRFANKNVLITGVAGFIGSHLAEKIMDEAGNVIGIDNYITGQKKHVDFLKNKYDTQFTFIEANASTDPHTYLNAQTRIDIVLHFASPASPPQYQKYPIETYFVNAFGTHALLSYLKENFHDAVFLYASTSEVYGDPLVHPQPETYWGNVNPNGVRSCYDESKRMGETVCGVFQRDFSQDVRIVRIFNTYGPRLNLYDGRVIPSFINSVLKKEPLQLFGDGSQTRSFCYVDDLVEGILLFVLHPHGNGQTINLGNPGEFTLLEAIQVFEKVVGYSLSVDHKPLPKDDPTRRQPDISKAKAFLNWEPKISFEEGLKKTIEYFKAEESQL